MGLPKSFSQMKQKTGIYILTLDAQRLLSFFFSLLHFSQHQLLLAFIVYFTLIYYPSFSWDLRSIACNKQVDQASSLSCCRSVGQLGQSAPHVFILMPTLRRQKLCKESRLQGSGMRFVFTNAFSKMFVRVYFKCFISTHLQLLIYQGIFFKYEFPSWDPELFLLYKPYL